MKNQDNALSVRQECVTCEPTKPAPLLQGAFSLLLPGLRRTVDARGYVAPTPIQEESIPHLLAGRDLLGCAQTGTGKTAAFILPILNRLATKNRRAKSCAPSVLILAPTRELTAQIGQSIKDYGSSLKVSYTTVFGGVRQYHQVRALTRGVDILVATPGRLLDLKKQGYVKLDRIETFVLDEMDRMLDMGFLPSIRLLVDKLPTEHQTILFSATMPRKVKELAGTILSDPIEVNIEPEKQTVDGVSQKVFFVGKQNKDALLISMLGGNEIDKALVFMQMKHSANRLVQKLKASGVDVEAFHGDKSQFERTQALSRFKTGKVRVLVATDVAARGLDVHDISHVINYDLPPEAETYVHRIGRTARAGALGDAISFCSAEDRKHLHGIELMLGGKVDCNKDHEFHCEQAFRSNSKPEGKRGKRGKPGRYRSKGKKSFQSRRRQSAHA